MKTMTEFFTGFYNTLKNKKFGKSYGLATLDDVGRIPFEQLPESAMTYEGNWNASTNTPTLTNGVGTTGMFYVVEVGGTWNGIEFFENDRVIYDGANWERLPAGQVSSVNGMTGPVELKVKDFGNGSVIVGGKDSNVENLKLSPTVSTTANGLAISTAGNTDSVSISRNSITFSDRGITKATFTAAEGANKITDELTNAIIEKANTFQPGEVWGANLGSGLTIQFSGVSFSNNALVTIHFPKSTKDRTVTWNPGNDFKLYCNGKITNLLTSDASWQLQRVTDWVYRFSIPGTYDNYYPAVIGTNGWFSFS